jgi:hypothetical protein
MTRRIIFTLFLVAVTCAVTATATVTPDRPLFRDAHNVLALRPGKPTTFRFRVFRAYAEQERITLAAPETAPNNLTYRVERLHLQDDDPATASVDEGMVHIQLLGVERPVAVNCVYHATTNPTGSFLVVALNKANLSSAYAGNGTTGSLKQRIFHRLVVMNEAPAVCGRSLAGSLSGSPQ